ncbi:hypothetical protein RND71_032009 [Anisodus tanguticus]|uniref:Uncharacterized protein n=1 Tax=Anisodus tanguticus TaxID=243964 RepID=A0AAE1V5D7_9SOLA|nr:hypothetical protein RND71_032009 [Anisodus tanguticus]
MLTPNVGSCTGIHTSQHSSCSFVPATSTPASSTPSISGLRIEVPAAPSSPSIDSTTPATSQRQNVKETLEYDECGRLIIIPDGEEEVSSEGFIPSCAGNMVTASFKPFMRDAWGRYKDIPYDVRFQIQSTWKPRYEDEINTIFEKKVTLRIKEHLYDARKLNKKPEWLRDDRKLNGGEAVPSFEVFAETHNKRRRRRLGRAAC